MKQKLILCAALGAGGLGLSGCVAFDGEIQSKATPDGKSVKVKFALCYDQGACQDQMMRARRGSSETRLLLGFRVPDGTRGPDKFASTDVPNVKFKPSRSYSSQMDRKAPRDKSQHWLGYISNSPPGGIPSNGKVKLTLDVPDNAGKVFRYRPVVGYLNGAPIDKVQCANDPRSTKTVGEGDATTDIVCVDDPVDNLGKDLKVPLD